MVRECVATKEYRQYGQGAGHCLGVCHCYHMVRECDNYGVSLLWLRSVSLFWLRSVTCGECYGWGVSHCYSQGVCQLWLVSMSLLWVGHVSLLYCDQGSKQSSHIIMLLFFQHLLNAVNCGACRVSSWVNCPDGKSKCPQSMTCCQTSIGGFACCPEVNVSIPGYLKKKKGREKKTSIAIHIFLSFLTVHLIFLFQNQMYRSVQNNSFRNKERQEYPGTLPSYLIAPLI